MSRANQWLRGIRVLDLSRYIPGPLATMLLADLGAEVLKIEAPDGDEMRHLGPRDAAGEPIFYPSLNAGKTVRRMNLKNEGERAEFLRLAESADVLLESFRPGVMAKLGIGYDKLRSINPRLDLLRAFRLWGERPPCSRGGTRCELPCACGRAVPERRPRSELFRSAGLRQRRRAVRGHRYPRGAQRTRS